MEDRDRFSNLPTLDSDDKIIDAVLSGLTHCRLKECQPFVLHRQAMDLLTVSRVISFMKTQNLVDYNVGEYDQDAFDYELRLTERGDFITNSGGWIAYLEKNTSELEWIDKILYAAKDGIGEYHDKRFLIKNYEKAVDKLMRDQFIEPYSKISYTLLPNGEKAIELGGYANWLEAEEKQKAATSKSNTINFHGSVMNPIVNQDSDFRDLNILSPTIKNAPHENQPRPSPIKKSDHTIWDKIKYISVIVGGLTALALAVGKLLKWW